MLRRQKVWYAPVYEPSGGKPPDISELYDVYVYYYENSRLEIMAETTFGVP